jgi:RNA polymerase sigma-70 factor (ECF subfamily)
MANTDPRSQYEQWVRTYAPELFRFAYRLSGSHAVAEDLTQETFAEAWKSRANQREPSKARAWLFQILRFRYSHHLRDGKHRLRASSLGEGMDAPVPGRPALDALADKEALQNALGELSPDVRETFLMVFMQGYKCREVAAELHIPLGTVLSRLGRARLLLRSRLGFDDRSGSHAPRAGSKKMQGDA